MASKRQVDRVRNSMAQLRHELQDLTEFAGRIESLLASLDPKEAATSAAPPGASEGRGDD